MKPDPIFSGEVLKAAVLFFLALAIGGAAVAVATGSLHVSLPDVNLPDTETQNGGVTNLQNTDLSDTTIDPSEPEPVEPAIAEPMPVDPFTTAGLTDALGKVSAELGAPQLTRMFINDVQTQFIVRTGGESVRAYSVRADDGSLGTQDASISITGNATIDDFAFPLAAVRPAAIDRMVARAGKLSGAADFQPTVLSLERDLTGGLKAPEWTINAEGGGRSLVYKARLDGGRVRNVGGGGAPIPQAAIDARKLNDCIQAAESDPGQIQSCFEQFTP